MTKARKKLVIDAALTILLVAAMFIQVTGVVLHEIIGMAMFVLVVVHLVLERKWLAKTLKQMASGSLKKARAAKTAVAGLLLASMIAMAVSSVMISTILYRVGLDLSAMNSTGVWTMIHIASAYVICGLVAVHLVMHWALIVGCFKVPYNPSRRAAIGTAANAVAAVGVVALGVAGAQALGSNWEAMQGANTEPALPQEPAPAPAPEGSSEKRGKRSKVGEESAAGTGQPAGTTSPSQSSGESSSYAQSSSGGTSSSSSSQSGVCTLCKKYCPLTNPRCNKPYQAGLI